MKNFFQLTQKRKHLNIYKPKYKSQKDMVFLRIENRNSQRI